MAVSVTRRIVEEVVDYLTDTLSRVDLERLITEHGVWKAFVDAAELSREGEVALRDALKKHLAQNPTDKNKRLEEEQKKKRFLKEFPQLKSKLEEHIQKLRSLADHLDKVHSGCTISNVVAESTSTVSGVLGILGLVLTPITGGTSLMLPAVSLGLVASMASLTTTIVEESSRLSDESEASRLVGASMNTFHELMKIMPKITVKLSNTGVDLISACKSLKELIRAIRISRAGYRPLGQIAEGIYAEGSRELGNALRASIEGVSVTSFFLALDVYHLVTDSIDLYNGATTESAAALRKLALMLERKLQEFEKIHKALQ
ncbi:apolipoprotein L3-like [Arvicola amphibius]|uniref:apolipoprotein L3-like n=1 Tax=Arvicola amphibius TaxID=1047088 RepID=UPI0018E3ED3F|nr:apolipoprotein L3-like [Arvicola amphibius]